MNAIVIAVVMTCMQAEGLVTSTYERRHGEINGSLAEMCNASRYYPGDGDVVAVCTAFHFQCAELPTDGTYKWGVNP